jgi:valyl-tRNA synthetase
MTTAMPSADAFVPSVIAQFEQTKQIVAEARRIRAEKNIPFKESLEMYVKAENFDHSHDAIVAKLLNLSKIEATSEKIAGAATFMVRTDEFYIPLGNLIDKEAELEKLQKELEYQQGFLEIVQKKLSNEKFVGSAPAAVVDKERKKMEEAEMKIKAISEQMTSLA